MSHFGVRTLIEHTSTREVTSECGRLAGRVAVVTGATSGIGRAIALALVREDAFVCVVGRDKTKLAAVVSATKRPSFVRDFSLDLTARGTLTFLVDRLEASGKLDILVHGSGMIELNRMDQSRIEDLDAQYAINVRVPYLMTQLLLPLLTRSRGQVVFINSSAGLMARRPEVGQYSATKHALKAIADSLREEVNAKGVRVLSVYAGRTATSMQERIFRKEGRGYDPSALLQPEDIAAVVLHSLMLPPTAEVTDINIRPMRPLL